MTGSEVVSRYEIGGKYYVVYGCWDSDTPKYKYDFYDVFEQETRECLNLGNPIYYEEGVPSRELVIDMISGKE